MSASYEGILIKTDAAVKQYLLHLDEQQQREGAGAQSFVISHDLDDRHVLVKEWAVQMIQEKVEELQKSNSYNKGDEQMKPPPAKKMRKKKDKEESESTATTGARQPPSMSMCIACT